jgi:hypothetical protein
MVKLVQQILVVAVAELALVIIPQKLQVQVDQAL